MVTLPLPLLQQPSPLLANKRATAGPPPAVGARPCGRTPLGEGGPRWRAAADAECAAVAVPAHRFPKQSGGLWGWRRDAGQAAKAGKTPARRPLARSRRAGGLLDRQAKPWRRTAGGGGAAPPKKRTTGETRPGPGAHGGGGGRGCPRGDVTGRCAAPKDSDPCARRRPSSGGDSRPSGRVDRVAYPWQEHGRGLLETVLQQRSKTCFARTRYSLSPFL